MEEPMRKLMNSARELAQEQQSVAEDAKWPRAIRAKRRVLGRIVTGLTPKPQIGPESQAIASWKVGHIRRQTMGSTRSGSMTSLLVGGQSAADLPGWDERPHIPLDVAADAALPVGGVDAMRPSLQW